MSTQLQALTNDIYGLAPTFETVLADPGLKFEAEAGFAVQLLQGNDYLAKVAYSNRQSLANAVTNVAAIGISLNPAKKQAYLVPRDGRVCLDISYMGLMHLAQQTGAIQWGQAAIVRANDQFELVGIDAAPIHKFNPFASVDRRGEIVGAYVVVKTDGGDYLTHPMAIADIYAIRDRTDGWKKHVKEGKRTPWATDAGEMIKKTVVKQASKYWPHRDRLQSAIHHLDTDGGEGIQMDGERDITPSTSEQQDLLTGLLREYERTWEQLSAVICKGVYQGKAMPDVTATDMETMIKFVGKKIDDTKNKQPAAA